MRSMMLPRRRRKGEDPDQIYWVDGPEQRRGLQEYCRQDVVLERAVHERLPSLSPAEQELWQLDALINERGFAVDVGLARAARAMAQQEQASIDAEIVALTDGEVTTVNQVAKITAFVRHHGHALASLTKRSVAAVLAHDPDEKVQRLFELRQAGALASARKLERLLASVDGDQRLRGALRFHGAATGRWSGRGFQPQNLKKVKTEHLGEAIRAILAGNIKRVRAIGAPLVLAGEILRSLICAAPGHRLIGADFSAIESRVLSWLSGETWKIETYREYDRTGDPKLEPYCVTASRILQRPVTPDDEAGRGTGKVADLACGYGGSVGAWRRFAPEDERSDAEILQDIRSWRAAHPATVRFWRTLERAAHRAILTGLPVKLGALNFVMEAGTLFLTLPSGRRLAYPEARLVPGKFEGTREVQFKDNANGNWVDRGAWYGTLVENLVQAISRDLLAAAMQRLETAGYPVALHVHDEVVTETPGNFGSEAEFLQIMLMLPGWASGLPIAAKAWSGRRYAKVKTGKLPDPMLCSEVDATPPEPSTALEVSARRVSSSEDGSDCTVPLTALIGEPLVNGVMNCPFHDDAEPSLKIYDDHYHCYGCGAHGNQLDWLMQVEGLSRKQARKRLTEWDGPALASRQAREDEDALTLARAARIWDGASSLAGTPAATYLARRGIDLAALPGNIDGALRFHPRCPFGSGTAPCLIALFRDVGADTPAGIHRIALTSSVRAWRPGTPVERRMLGRWPMPRAVKLWPATRSLVVGEGIETVLAAATRLPYRDAPLRPAWATVSAGALGRFPVLERVERLIILVDNDVNGAGQAEARRCSERWSRAAHTVVKLTPKRAGTDFNDVVLSELRP
jgi:DNA polymerase